MTTPRKDVVDPTEEGTYHCWSRCVRRAFLCGIDKLTGRDYSHRKAWVENRLKHLSQCFAICVLAYAIMENHSHLILRNKPSKARKWSPEEVARRWRLLFPLRRAKDGSPEEPNEAEILAISKDPKRVELLRSRLSDVSWFMRCLNENIAKKANREDEVTGRFWEGRFKSTRLDNLGSVLTCMVYVDLNPIRARAAKSPEESGYTSVFERILLNKGQRSEEWLPPIEEIFHETVSLEEYLSLVDSTGRKMAEGKKGRIDPSLEPILERLKIRPSQWGVATQEFRRRFCKIAGTQAQVRKAAKRAGKHWFWGVSAAAKFF